MNGDPWPMVDAWAQRQDYGVVQQDAGHRLYSKGSGFMVGARKVDIVVTGNEVRLEAWVAGSGFARAMSLFLLPREITVESGGVKAVMPRKMGRTEVNDLMAAFGQPAIP